jgi:hypothetical protein
VEPRLKRIRGVTTAFYYPERSLAGASLADENRVTLAVVRDAMKSLGYTPGDAQIVVVGVAKAGKLSLPHQPEAFVLENAADASGRVRIEGSVAAGTDILRVRSVAKEE